MNIRIGNGFDIHKFSDDPDRQLVLGGVVIPEAPGLIGHSDADVIAHAIADGLLGAAGLGDIGMHFPDTDPTWKGADSLAILGGCVDMVATHGWSVVNVDCSVIAEQPKLAPYRIEMQDRLGSIVNAPVSIKGRRAETLGALGRGEGIVCLASVLIQQVNADS